MSIPEPLAAQCIVPVWVSTIVALGATAARSLTGRAVIIGKVRGKPLPTADGTTLVFTVHPSAQLRIEDDDERHAAYRGFVADLKAAAAAAHARAGGKP
jgi:DNA polymerase